MIVCLVHLSLFFRGYSEWFCDPNLSPLALKILPGVVAVQFCGEASFPLEQGWLLLFLLRRRSVL